MRISAQLIQAENGLQIWSENYDRDLTDIFAIQEDIARAITTSLRMPLGLKPGENLVNNRAKNPASYEDYLRAKALVRARNARSVAEAVKLLEQVRRPRSRFRPRLGLSRDRVPLHTARRPGAAERRGRKGAPHRRSVSRQGGGGGPACHPARSEECGWVPGARRRAAVAREISPGHRPIFAGLGARS